MVSSPDYSYEDPSATWTNYSSNPEIDGSCKRLIHVPNNYDGNRFYLKYVPPESRSIVSAPT